MEHKSKEQRLNEKAERVLAGHARADVLLRRYRALTTQDRKRLYIKAREALTERQNKEDLHSAYQTALKSSTTDYLTGCLNRAGGEKQFNLLCHSITRRNIAAAEKGQDDTPNLLGVIMLDIDHFKNVNDTYGHGAGDIVLKEIVRRIIHPKAGEAPSLRTNDVFFRYGGEEFCILIETETPDGAMKLAERCRQAIRKEKFAVTDNHGRAHNLKLTASFGVTTIDPSDKGCMLDKLKSLADAALYQAKDAGRDRVVSAGTPVEEKAKPEIKPQPQNGSRIVGGVEITREEIAVLTGKGPVKPPKKTRKGAEPKV